MKLAHSLSAIALSVAFLGGIATPAFADVPKAPRNIAVIDTNNNGRIEKEEFLAHMSTAFDKTAGDKGYCTFEEVQDSFQQLQQMILP